MIYQKISISIAEHGTDSRCETTIPQKSAVFSPPVQFCLPDFKKLTDFSQYRLKSTGILSQLGW